MTPVSIDTVISSATQPSPSCNPNRHSNKHDDQYKAGTCAHKDHPELYLGKSTAEGQTNEWCGYTNRMAAYTAMSQPTFCEEELSP